MIVSQETNLMVNSMSITMKIRINTQLRTESNVEFVRYEEKELPIINSQIQRQNILERSKMLFKKTKTKSKKSFLY